MKNPMINSDASYSIKWKKGAYAYWVEVDGNRYAEAGMLPGDVMGPGLAELLAFSKALGKVNEMIPAHKRWGVKLYINTDCIYVIHVIDGTLKNSKYPMLIKAIRHAMNGYHLLPKHVRAHTGHPDDRSRINDWCDVEARKIMQKEGYLHD